MNKAYREVLLALGLIGLGLVFRLIPHPANVSPLLAIGLFAGRWMSKSWAAVLVPLVAMLVSDLWLGGHSLMLWVYGGLCLSVFVGWFTKAYGPLTVTVSGVGSSFLFFVISNFGVWISSTWYSKDWMGLADCYIRALPFLHHSLLGDLVFVGLLLGIERLSRANKPFTAQA